jgi:hypothetical protein
MTATQTISVSQSGETASTTLSISSPAPLGALAVQDVEGSLAVDPSGTAISVALPLAPSPVQVVEESSAFLQQMNVTLHIDMPSSPRLLAVTLASENDFILFDCSFPFVRENPREYRLLIGAFPPDPLPLQLSLPADGTFTVTITMDFDAPLIGVQVQPRSDAHVVTRIKVVRSVEVKT